MSTRRTFLKATALAAATTALSRSTAAPYQALGVPVPEGEHTLPPLPYAYDALEPFIDEQTMRIHHDKHHAGYVKGLNAAEAALAKARETKDFDLIQHWSRKAAFNGGGHFLHSMFWSVMAPPGKGGGGEPSGELQAVILRSFGSFEAFKAQFTAAAASVEGSGWGLVHYRRSDDRLLILQAENQHKLSPWDSTPIMGIDVWEHAYYLKYQNDRSAYITAWWNVVHWKEIERRLDELR
jgi:superoxide dismutase, Fe-Mn family